MKANLSAFIFPNLFKSKIKNQNHKITKTKITKTKKQKSWKS
jgi:hypothetical protein